MRDEFEIFLTNGRLRDGIKKCDKILKKSKPADHVFIYKARFLRLLGHHQEADAILSTLADRTPPITNTATLDNIDVWLLEDSKDFPHSLTNGPIANKLWTNCIAATPRQQVHHAYQDRWDGAVRDRRWQDAGATLAGWRKMEPGRKDLRLMHVAILQLTADVSATDMARRISNQLAMKTLEQSAELITTGADLLLAIDIAQKQNDFRFVESFLKPDTRLFTLLSTSYEAIVRLVIALATESASTTMQSRDILIADILGGLWTSRERQIFKTLAIHRARALEDWRLFKALVDGCWTSNASSATHKVVVNLLADVDSPISRSGFLVVLWIACTTGWMDEVLRRAQAQFDAFRCVHSCSSDLREFVLSLPRSHQVAFRTHIQQRTMEHMRGIDRQSWTDQQIVDLINTESNALKLDYLLTIGSTPNATEASSNLFITNAVQLADLEFKLCGRTDVERDLLISSAAWCAYERSQDPRHALFAASVLYQDEPGKMPYPSIVMLVGILKALGLIELALHFFDQLGVKEIQLETASHIGLSRISTLFPIGAPGVDKVTTSAWLSKVLRMYDLTDERIADQQQSLIKAARPDLMLELEDLRKCLRHSVNRRIMMLEHRRVNRLQNRTADSELFMLQPEIVQMWTDKLEDRRDFDILPNFESRVDADNLERRLHFGGKIPDANWIRYHLWIDQICSIISDDSLVYETPVSQAPASSSSSLTRAEAALTPFWEALGAASIAVLLNKESTDAEIEQTLDSLQGGLGGLPPQGMTLHEPSTEGVSLPQASTLQSYIISIDFLQCVGRFAMAAQEVNKGKRSGKKTPSTKIDDLLKTARTSFDALIRLATHISREIDPMPIQTALLAQWKMYGGSRPGEDERLRRMASYFAASARSTWDNVLALKFPV